jgi:hypothetical protein
MRFLHAADIHLDSPMRGLGKYEGAPVERMRSATRRALSNLVDLCLAERVDFVVIAGDLYDGGWRDHSTGLFFAQQMLRLRDAGIPVVMVRGNHDAASQITKHLRLPDNVHELSSRKPETFELPALGVCVHGQSFATRAVTDDLASRYPPAVRGAFNVGLLHTCAEGREGHEAYAPCTIETLRAKGYDYWALGHVHAREVLSTEPWIVFSGNLQGRHIRESGAKGATLVTVEGGKVASVEHRALDVVRWRVCEVDAGGAASGDEAMGRARPNIAGGVVFCDGRPVAARVVVRGATRAHAALERDGARFTAELRLAASDVGGDALWLEKALFETRVPIDLDGVRERDDVIGQIVHSIEALRGDDATASGLFAEIAELAHKLPNELREGLDGWNLDDPAQRRAILGDVEQMLLSRLLYEEARE